MRRTNTHGRSAGALVLALLMACADDTTNTTPNTSPDAGVDAAADSAADAGGGDATDARAPRTDGLECDVIDQDCAAGSKCTAVASNTGAPVNRCVSPVGAKVLDEACTRSTGGTDDCASGLFCTFRPGPQDAPLACRKLCTKSSDCAAVGSDHACRAITYGPSAVAGSKGYSGTCHPKCTPFGTDCAAGTTCLPLADPDFSALNPVCIHGDGTNADVGASCTNNQCKVGLVCTATLSLAAGGSGVCRELCDGTHSCATGTCKPIALASGGLGICE
jgi:hypothetical protein